MAEQEILKLQKEIEKLKKENADLKKKKKFGLVWEDREREKNIDDGEYYPYLVQKGEGFGFDNGDSNKNILIEGDNYHALEILQYTHKGKIDVIYIDPPYNTGKKKEFKYGDRWIDADDGYRHSYWLSFMNKRLKLAKTLLSSNGIIFISIDDNEHARLKLLCDDIFNPSNFIGNITWEKRTKAQNTKTAKDLLQSKTEYILVYKRSSEKARFNLEKNGVKTYDLKDEKGAYRLKVIEEMSALGMRSRETMIFPIKDLLPRENNQWKVGKDEVLKYEHRGDLDIVDGKAYFRVRPEDEDNEKTLPFWSHFFDKDIGTAESGKTELSEVLGTKEHGFETVKPLALIKKLIKHVKVKNNKPIILDFFAGSGTTGHAVMELHKDDFDTSPQYILVTNNDESICEEITYKRLLNSNNGYIIQKKKNTIVKQALNSNLEYLKTELLKYDPDKHSDLDIKEFMVDKLTEIIKVREACFALEDINSYLQKFNKDEKSVYILHDIYKMSKNDYDQVIEILNNDTKQDISIYILSMSNHSHYANKIAKASKNITFEPLPESFLKMLRKIQRKQK